MPPLSGAHLAGVPFPRVFGLLAVAAAATGIAIGISSPQSAAIPAAATTTPPVATIAPAATTAPATTTPTTTQPTTTPTPAPAPAPTPAPAPAPTPAPTPRPTAQGAWPAGRDGYTDVLASIAVSAGRTAAAARARAARRAGVPQVGVLLSSSFTSLRSGYWVVFSGVYDSATAAENALARVRLRGFTDAYPRRIAR